MSARWLSLAVAATLLLIAAMGCSGDGSPLAPDVEPLPGHSGAGKTVMLGLYQVVIDVENANIRP